MYPMDRREREALDRHITGNYGEDQFRDVDEDACECNGGAPCNCPDCDCPDCSYKPKGEQ